jgi:hypothetical protein
MKQYFMYDYDGTKVSKNHPILIKTPYTLMVHASDTFSVAKTSARLSFYRTYLLTIWTMEYR